MKKDIMQIPYSKQVKTALMNAGGSTRLRLLNGDICHVIVNSEKTGFVSDKLNNFSVCYRFEVFDVIQELLTKKGGQAIKGTGRGKENKVGYGKCGLDTVVGYIAYHYSGIQIGGSAYDPVFVLAAILDWANIARNCRGYIEAI